MAANPRGRNDGLGGDDALGIIELNAGASWDRRVMDRIIGGDDAAMMLLYDRYCGLVFSIAVHVLGDNHVAEDIAQEVFLHLWRNPVAFHSEKGSLAGWLAVITRHRAIDLLRKRRKECSIDTDESSDCNLQDQIELSERVSKLAAVFPLMPASQRVALELAYFYGLSHTEISARTGEPLGTVKSRIRLALEFLRKTLVNREPPKYPVPVYPTVSVKRK